MNADLETFAGNGRRIMGSFLKYPGYLRKHGSEYADCRAHTSLNGDQWIPGLEKGKWSQ